MNGVPDCSILVPSCDKYSDMWTPFFKLFWRHWPDCPFPVYLGSNTEQFDDPRVRMIPVGHRGNWTSEVSRQINALRTPYVLLCLEDFFLRRSVETREVALYLDRLRALDGHVVRLVPNPGPDAPAPEFPGAGLVTPEAPYRVSAQAAIWNAGSLLSLMREGESIWEFELRGSERSGLLPAGFYCARKPVFCFGRHVVERGKWFRGEAGRFGRMNIGCDFQRRPVMSWGESVRWKCLNLRSKLLRCIPWRQRRKVAELIRSYTG